MADETKNKDKIKTDWRKYIKSLNRKTWTACLIVLGGVILFHETVIEVLNSLFVQPFLKACPEDFSGNIVVLGILIWAITHLIRQYRKRLKITMGSLVICATTLLIYYYYFRFNPFFGFYHLSFCPSIAYWDIVLISILILTARYQSFLLPIKAESSQLTLIEDSPLPTSDDDIYEREAYAKHICQHILATFPRDAFAIGVIGDWGSGKTQFLLRLKTILVDNNPDTIVVEFNPWRAGKPDAIIDDFFKHYLKN